MSQQDEKLFGEFAVGEGHITHEQLDECLTLKAHSGDDKTLWEILVEKSYLDLHVTNQLLDKIERRKTVARSKRKVEKFFGDIAVSSGFCTAEQMEQAIAEQKMRMAGGRNQRLGEICVEMGILALKQVAQVLEEQNRSLVICEGCGSAYNVGGFPSGKRWRCKVCNAMLEVPGAPAFASVPIEQLASEQFEQNPEDQTEMTFSEQLQEKAVKAPGGPAKTEKKKFGNYYIIEKIARGGMGIIYKARQRGLDRIVALKVLIAGESASEETIKRFYREAKSAAKLRHPNIVPIHEVGIHENKHFLTMDFIHGENLRHIILNQKINHHWALEVTAKVARALHYAHERGIVHRDVKPENILLDETGEPQITDFGLAVDIGIDANLTRAGVVMGTPAYMSPEQAKGERSEIDSRSDVYSLGAVLYEMLTGSQVFKFEGPIGLNSLLKTISQEPTPPRRVNPRIPREIETIVLKALEKDVERRYQSAEEFAQDIDRYLTGEPILAKPPSFIYRSWKKIKKYKVVSVSLLTAIVAVVAVAVYFIGERIEMKRRQDAQFSEYLEKAEESLAQGKYTSAKNLYIQAKTLRPDDLEVARGLVKVNIGIKDRETNRQTLEAEERAQTAVLDGNTLLTSSQASEDPFEVRDLLLKAIRVFDRATANDPANVDAKQGKFNAATRLGKLYMEDKDYGVAVLMFSFAQDTGIDNIKAAELATAARKARQKAEEFEKLLTRANKMIGEARWDDALRQLQLARKFEGITESEKQEVEDRISDALYSRYFEEGENARQERDPSRAIEAFLEAAKYKETPEVAERLRSVRLGRLMRRGGNHLAREEHSDALRAYLEAKEHASDPAEQKNIIELIEECKDGGFHHHFNLAMMAKTACNWEESEKHLEQSLSFMPEDRDTRKLISEVKAAKFCPEDMVFIFSGKFTLGSTVPDDRNPLREVSVNCFYIGELEVSNEEYQAFVSDGGYSKEKYWEAGGFKMIAEVFMDRTGKPGPATWENGSYPQGKDYFPVTGVSWYETRAYANWRCEKLAEMKGEKPYVKEWRLPTEEEWERAASINDGNDTKLTYPWGDEWSPDFGNFMNDEVTKVGSFPEDMSPAGCFDMGGNAFEWTSSVYGKKGEYRVIRGGSVGLNENTLKRFARTTKRKCPKPTYRSPNTGFRLAATPGGN